MDAEYLIGTFVNLYIGGYFEKVKNEESSGNKLLWINKAEFFIFPL